MSRNQEIKVYLPVKLVGELEAKKRAGTRSKFIREAIQEKIKRVEKASLDDWQSIVMLCCVRDRLFKSIGYGISKETSEIYQTLLQMIIDYLGEN
tara:strand:- start:951 stop:1235 length:285 start_codon:yes stop_codon:yes gene_type:complete